MNKSVDFEKLSAYTTPEESPGYLLWRVSTAWRSFIEDTLKPLDLTHPQFVILATIGWLTRTGDYVSQIDISKSSGLDPNTTSQIMRGLEAKNFIKRSRALNERSKNPMLTTLGSSILSKALPAVENDDIKFFERLNSQESAELLKIFQKLIKN